MPRDPQTGRFTKSSPVPASVTKAKPAELRNELGISTRHRVGRNLYDDFLPQLRGQQAARVYREMADNDPTVGGILFAVESLLRELTWTPVPADDSPLAEEIAEFVDGCMQDMTHSWDDHISGVLSMIPFGFSAFEIVYRMRRHADGSKFDDGRWGWRKLAFRPQDTISEILTDPHGGVMSIEQHVSGGVPISIPIEKALLYRTTVQRGPEGRSLLRNAYVPWFYKKRAEALMLIGIERDLAGLPVMKVPAEVILEGGTEYQMWKNFVTRTKRDEQEGALIPSERDENGNLMYEFELMTSGGGEGRIQGVLEVTRSLAADIASSVLADWISLGRDAVGSRALAEPKIKLFTQALEAVADNISEVQTRHLIPRLVELNGWPRNLSPTMEHSPLEDVDLGALGSFMRDTAQAGMTWASEDGELERQLMEMAGFDAEPMVEAFE